MRRGLETVDRLTSEPSVWFVGIAIIILAFFGGISILRLTTVNTEQICISHGGSYSHKDDNRSLRDAKTGSQTDEGHTVTETCTGAKP